jgi:hypothetical protein
MCNVLNRIATRGVDALRSPCRSLTGSQSVSPHHLRFRMTFQTHLPRCSSRSRDPPRIFCFTFFTRVTGKFRVATRKKCPSIYRIAKSRIILPKPKVLESLNKQDWGDTDPECALTLVQSLGSCTGLSAISSTLTSCDSDSINLFRHVNK